MSPDSYAKIKGPCGEALTLTGSSPLNWERRCSALAQYGLGDRVSMNKWREAAADLATWGFLLPMDFAHLDYTAVMQITRRSDLWAETKQFRQAEVLSFQEPGARDVVKFSGVSDAAENHRRLVKWAHFQKTKLARRLAGATGRMRLCKDFPQMGPAAKLKAPKTSDMSKNKTKRFFAPRDRVNLSKSTRPSNRTFAAGSRSFSTFCELKDIEPCPA